MLRELHISNLAVIADARIELHPALNCFTGATGAGKSLVIGAIEILLGLRSPAEMLRSGVDEGRVSGVFEIANPALLQRIERATDIPVTRDGGELLLTRRLFASGRSSASLNGHPITLTMLKQISEHLVDVHGQHDHQYLLRPSNQIDVLDQYGQLDDLRKQYHEVYLRLQAARQRLEELTANRTLREQQLDLYRFQADEIDAAELDPGEYEELQARSNVLHNLGKLKKDVGATHAALYEADGSILERLKMMSGVLSELTETDASLRDISQAMRETTINLEEVAFDLSRYLDKLDLDPSEAAEVDDRLNTINRIVSKYGSTVEDVLEHREQIGRQIAELERATEDFSHLEAEIPPLEKQLKQLSQELSRRRAAVAGELAPRIEAQLADLGMDKARFTIALSAAEAPSPAGVDQIEFTVQTNPGLAPQPLRKIASGGELSRIMLAMKGILADSDRISVLVFDEIDANVGGRLGSVIGRRLRQLAGHHQVLCITHLSQIASYADRHLTVRKHSDGGQTTTTVRVMAGEERIEELAEMIGGQHITPTTRAQARELLESARTGMDAPPAKATTRRARKRPGSRKTKAATKQ